MHIFPQLRKLEQKYPNELVVIGVHSAKFTSEQETANIHKAIMRYEIEHPVVNDKDFRIWSQYSARAWPTLYIVDPEGKILGRHEGEITFEAFDRVIGDMIEEFEARGTLDRTPIPGIGGRREEGEVLSFPSKVIADPSSDRIFISDSSHNRVVASLEGKILEVIGEGGPGLRDGTFASALFDHPHGLALGDGVLYIADTENHVIRKADLARREVQIIAGTGVQARGFHGGGKADSVALNSPWDLALHNGTLYIAMAGFHQLWALDLSAGEVRPYAGSGREGISDGPLADAMLAQPNGITTDGSVLFFADSETSAIRTADLEGSGRVVTLVGTGLFDFGDVDGSGPDARLQHVQGLCYHDGVLYLADTYNNKIKRLDPKTRGVMSFLGSSEHGLQDGIGSEARFHEPEGLAISNGNLYITDTNNHAIRVANLQSGQVSTLELKF